VNSAVGWRIVRDLTYVKEGLEPRRIRAIEQLEKKASSVVQSLPLSRLPKRYLFEKLWGKKMQKTSPVHDVVGDVMLVLIIAGAIRKY